MTECRDFSKRLWSDDENFFDTHTYSRHPVDSSDELTKETLLGKGDPHNEKSFNQYKKKIEKIMEEINQGR